MAKAETKDIASLFGGTSQLVLAKQEDITDLWDELAKYHLTTRDLATHPQGIREALNLLSCFKRLQSPVPSVHLSAATTVNAQQTFDGYYNFTDAVNTPELKNVVAMIKGTELHFYSAEPASVQSLQAFLDRSRVGAALAIVNEAPGIVDAMGAERVLRNLDALFWEGKDIAGNLGEHLHRMHKDFAAEEATESAMRATEAIEDIPLISGAIPPMPTIAFRRRGIESVGMSQNIASIPVGTGRLDSRVCGDLNISTAVSFVGAFLTTVLIIHIFKTMIKRRQSAVLAQCHQEPTEDTVEYKDQV